MTTNRIDSSFGRRVSLGSGSDHISKRQVDSIISQVISEVSGVPPSSQPPPPQPFTSEAPPPPPFSSQVPPPAQSSAPPPPQSSATPPPQSAVHSSAPSIIRTSIASSIGSETVFSSTIGPLASSTQSVNGALTSQSPDENVPTAASENNGAGLGGGAIAGIAIAGVLVIAFIGGWFFWRRRRRTRGKPTSNENNDQTGTYGDGGIPELHTQERPQEMTGSRWAHTQELDPTQYSKYATNGSHELKTESEPVELLNGPDEYTAPVPYHVPQRPLAGMTETTNTTQLSNVEAQRRREMEWLEMEEERIRKRRELLAVQGGAKGS